MAPSFAETDWDRVRRYYDDLVSHSPTPIGELNRVVAVTMACGASAGWAALQELPESQACPYWATRAWVCARDDAPPEARTMAAEAVQRARDSAGNEAERRFWDRMSVGSDRCG
jgi:RNA polymerase sigma-70 factor (ECF subfamily)